jgi:sarcosine oxidase
MKRLEGLCAAWNAAGGDIALLGREECRNWSGSADYVGGLFHPTAGHVQPLSLVRGFAAAALRHGVRIFERSAAKAISRTADGKWTLRTETGSLVADQVVITTNAYTGDLWPKLKRTIMPLVSLQAATEPLSAAQKAEVLPRETTIADTRRAIFYGRYDRDGRLSIGCMGSDPDCPDALGGLRRLKSGTERIFPALKGISWQFKWGGRIAMTPDFLPHLHEPAPGLLVGLGFNGRGVAMTSVMGRALAAKLLGTRDSDLPFPISPLKAIPLHRILTAILPVAAPLLSAADRIDRIKP